MFLNRIIVNSLACVVALSSCGNSYAIKEANASIKIDELLSYACAKNVAGLLSRAEQRGPLFFEGKLAFTSVVAKNDSRVLIVSAGAGTYALNLNHSGVNRIRFELPVIEGKGKSLFFLSYAHNDRAHSRYFEFSADRAPEGHDELDYNYLEPYRAEYMLPNLEYAIYETSENALSAVTEGRMDRNQLRGIDSKNCDHIIRRSPMLARNLKRNLDILSVMSSPIRRAARMPASLNYKKTPTFGR